MEPDAVAGISIDGQMAGLVGVGADGKAVTPYDSWLDTRCTPYISLMKKEAGQEIISKSGGPPQFQPRPKNTLVVERAGRRFQEDPFLRSTGLLHCHEALRPDRRSGFR